MSHVRPDATLTRLGGYGVKSDRARGYDPDSALSFADHHAGRPPRPPRHAQLTARSGALLSGPEHCTARRHLAGLQGVNRSHSINLVAYITCIPTQSTPG